MPNSVNAYFQCSEMDTESLNWHLQMNGMKIVTYSISLNPR
jgi:hypothetical protein